MTGVSTQREVPSVERLAGDLVLPRATSPDGRARPANTSWPNPRPSAPPPAAQTWCRKPPCPRSASPHCAPCGTPCACAPANGCSWSARAAASAVRRSSRPTPGAPTSPPYRRRQRPVLPRTRRRRGPGLRHHPNERPQRAVRRHPRLPRLVCPRLPTRPPPRWSHRFARRRRHTLRPAVHRPARSTRTADHGQPPTRGPENPRRSRRQARPASGHRARVSPGRDPGRPPSHRNRPCPRQARHPPRSAPVLPPTPRPARAP